VQHCKRIDTGLWREHLYSIKRIERFKSPKEGLHRRSVSGFEVTQRLFRDPGFISRCPLIDVANFAKLAEAIGMMGVRIENPADVSSGLKLRHSGPALIDVVTDPNALSLPSHIEPEMIAGFGLTMGKLVLSGRIDEVVDTIKTNIRHKPIFDII
jgi:hypothetical protein